MILSFSLGLELQQRAACWLKFSWPKWKEIVVHGSELETARVLLAQLYYVRKTPDLVQEFFVAVCLMIRASLDRTCSLHTELDPSPGSLSLISRSE